MSEWIANSPFSSVLGIVIAVIILIIVSKLVHDVTRPIFLILVLVAGIMIFYNVIDLTLLASSGKKLFANCLGCGGDSADKLSDLSAAIIAKYL